MARVDDIAQEDMSAEQERLYREIAGVRGGAVGGPFAIWLRTPGIADAANRLGNRLRVEGVLDRRLFEIAVLVVARHWSAQYEWYAHAREAANVGLAADIIESIRTGERPAFDNAAAEAVYDASRELLGSRTLSERTYGRTVDALGLDRTIELVTVLGFYTMVAMMLNAFDAPVPGGLRPLD